MIRTLLVLAVLAGLGLAGGLYLRSKVGTAKTEEVPTFVVAQDTLVRRVVADGNLRAVKATPLTAPQSSGNGGPKKIAWLTPDGQRVKKGDVVVKFDATEPEKQLREGKADLESANARLAAERIKSKVAVEGRDATARLATDELEQTRKFQSKDKQIYSRNQIIESEIDETLAGARKEHAERTKEVERRLSQTKAGMIGVEQKTASVVIKHAQTALESMEIRAPHDGLFVLIRNWRGETPKLGDQLWPGQDVAEIPLLETMEAEVFVLELDGSGLKEGQPAEVVIEARPEVIHTGKIRLVDKLAKPRVEKVPIQYFAVVVELSTTDAAAMKPGQRVRATLKLDESSSLVVPRQAVFTKEGKSYVYRRTPRGDFEQVAIQLGTATAGRIAVTSGLAAGDRIALRDPTRSIDQTLSNEEPANAAPTGASSP
jgi:HlyD family secretion protein